ncbi:hypothetical protein HT031_001691 [Scenedesmus sp. PABB004]|nr:hypothetical protein HT031_001691 [Scenedesmus sp. PABB004]
MALCAGARSQRALGAAIGRRRPAGARCPQELLLSRCCCAAAAAAAAERQQRGAAPLLRGCAQAAAVAALAGCWLLARPAPVTAGVLGRSAPVAATQQQVQQQREALVVAPQATVTGGVARTHDSMFTIVAVCLGFYAVSATISAAIGAVCALVGRPLSRGTRSAASWGSGNVLDTLDIMRLPLAVEFESPPPRRAAPARGGGGGDVLLPWDGPEAYVPVSMVKVLSPGLNEAGLALRRPLEGAGDLTIISITDPAASAGLLDGDAGASGGATHGGAGGGGNGRANGGGAGGGN